MAEYPRILNVDAALIAGGICASGSAAVDYVTGFRCPIFALTGCWCAFCGATRAVAALAEGHPETALRDNSVVMLILAFTVVRAALRVAGGRRIVSVTDAWIERVDQRIWTGLLLAWTVMRNLPWFWFLGPVR